MTKLSISSRGLKRKLVVAFALMSVIPILVLGYVVSVYVFPSIDILTDFFGMRANQMMETISLITFIVLMTAILGFYVAKQTIDRVVETAVTAKLIASGRFERQVAATEEDELGDLAGSVNKLAGMIRSDLEEFKQYSHRTQEINIEIRKNLMALSGLLQVADLISSGSIESREVMELILDRVSQMVESSYTGLCLKEAGSDVYQMKYAHNVEGERLKDISVKMNQGILGRALFTKTPVVIDDAQKTKESAEFKNTYHVKNIVAVPIYSRKQALGLLVVGNRNEGFCFQKDELEFYKVFAKQIAIAMENDVLLKKVRELAIKDDLTGLFTEQHILGVLEEEIRRAVFFQRPCSFDIFNIDDFRVFRDTHGDLAAEEVLKRIAQMAKGKAGPVGKAARIGGDGFAILIPERNKKEASRIAEELRNEVASTDFVAGKKAFVTISGGVGENPLDGSTAQEVFQKAREALMKAKQDGKNRIVA